MKKPLQKLAASLLISALCSGQALAAQYSPGANDTTVKIGNTAPYTGPAAVFSQLPKIETLFFNMINAQGGVNGRKIEFLSRDDAYNPANTVKEVRRLIEQDQVLLLFSQTGTAHTLATRAYLNREKIPQLLVASGYSKLNDPTSFPYTFPGIPSYYKEGEAFAKLILREHPKQKIAVLYQNDDYGKDVLNGLLHGLGADAKEVISQSYEVTSPSVDTQVINLQNSGATVFMNIATARAAAQAIRKIAELNWKPTQYLNVVSTSKKLLGSLGEDKTKGIESIAYFKDASDPKFKNDPGMAAYLAFMNKYAAGSDPSDVLNESAYTFGQVLVEILKKAGDNLTRDNIKNIAANLNFASPLLIGNFQNTPANYSGILKYQPVVFDGHQWKPLDSEKAKS